MCHSSVGYNTWSWIWLEFLVLQTLQDSLAPSSTFFLHLHIKYFWKTRIPWETPSKSIKVPISWWPISSHRKWGKLTTPQVPLEDSYHSPNLWPSWRGICSGFPWHHLPSSHQVFGRLGLCQVGTRLPSGKHKAIRHCPSQNLVFFFQQFDYSLNTVSSLQQVGLNHGWFAY